MHVRHIVPNHGSIDSENIVKKRMPRCPEIWICALVGFEPELEFPVLTLQ
jgi:hypothetical protein